MLTSLLLKRGGRFGVKRVTTFSAAGPSLQTASIYMKGTQLDQSKYNKERAEEDLLISYY